MDVPVFANAESIIMEFIVDGLLAAQGRAGEEITSETSLFRTGIVDSFGLFQLVLHLEEQFQVTIADEEVVPENFETITTIITFLERKRSGLNGSAPPIVGQA